MKMHKNKKMKPWLKGGLPQNYAEHFLAQHAKSVIDFSNFKILDLGAGNGRYLHNFSQIMPTENLYALEIDDDALEILQNSGFQTMKAHPEKAAIPLEDNSIDIVISMDVFEHMPYDIYKQYLDEVKRVLKPSGKMVFSIPNYPIKRVFDFTRILKGKAKGNVKYYLHDDPTHINKMHYITVKRDLNKVFTKVQFKVTRLFFSDIKILGRIILFFGKHLYWIAHKNTGVAYK